MMTDGHGDALLCAMRIKNPFGKCQCQWITTYKQCTCIIVFHKIFGVFFVSRLNVNDAIYALCHLLN